MNYEFITILDFLERRHGIKILNRLKLYGLCRRGRAVDEQIVLEHIIRELDGSGVTAVSVPHLIDGAEINYHILLLAIFVPIRFIVPELVVTLNNNRIRIYFT
jgi:hypothetical protein